ncbi:MAG: hypothetical protein ABS43_00045 [Bordetella sp. SCN 67-23]|nr:hypothetical protein [Burkholderiales bacterium]ODS76787.1 MAG: hypothetical protein ABS43_00045 [Bordetella sp. SCN 67-23]OJW93625.1 MAG: hypothetical protein BGO71_16980 [Burkholderiales bacterium 67-32]
MKKTLAFALLGAVFSVGGTAWAAPGDIDLKCILTRADGTKTTVYLEIYHMKETGITGTAIYDNQGEERVHISASRQTGPNGVGKMYGHRGGDADGYIHDVSIGERDLTFSLTNTEDRSEYIKGEISRVTGKIWIADTINNRGQANGTCEPGERPRPATKF